MDYFLRQLTLLNFKNYSRRQFEFDKQLNYIIGLNGTGKTSLIDAIYYLCMAKSALFKSDIYSLRTGETLFFIKGFFEKLGIEYKITCSFENKKILKLNDKPYIRLSEHIGLLPCVVVLPSDTNLIFGSSQVRRRFVDLILCQTSKTYVQNLVNYNTLIKQRNQSLKDSLETGKIDQVLFQTWDNLLVPLNKTISTARRDFIEIFKTYTQKYYNALAPVDENIDLEYITNVEHSNFENKFKTAFRREVQLGRTLMGVHKDDFNYYLNGKSLRYYGSQGQQKTYILALKLAHYEFCKVQSQVNPILLLDDIFDKIDEERYSKLLELVCQCGQVFITDVSRRDLPKGTILKL